LSGEPALMDDEFARQRSGDAETETESYGGIRGKLSREWVQYLHTRFAEIARVSGDDDEIVTERGRCDRSAHQYGRLVGSSFTRSHVQDQFSDVAARLEFAMGVCSGRQRKDGGDDRANAASVEQRPYFTE
jgi:hypothetical protein